MTYPQRSEPPLFKSETHEMTCKTCDKVINHDSGYCLQHRREWREGFKAGLRTKESVGDESIDKMIEQLEIASTNPMVKYLSLSPLLIRSANALKRLSKNG